MKQNTIGVIPKAGYRKDVNQSVIGLTWLEELNEKIENFRWKLSADGEIQIGKHVDGYEVENGVIYQFHGCLYHGCVKCYSSDDYNNVLNMSFGRLRGNTNSVTHYLRQRGFEVVEMWKCDYKLHSHISTSMISSACLRFDKYLPLHPCQALYDGRTSPTWLKRTCINEAKIYYIDFTSLYPSVHPSILVGDECDNISHLTNPHFCGLVKCDILSPKNLYNPVLPCKFNGKLIFTLCRSCVFDTQEQHKVNIDCQEFGVVQKLRKLCKWDTK